MGMMCDAQVDVQLTRASKPVANGPQSYGAPPVVSEIRVLAFDHSPNAQCTSIHRSATDDSSANGGLGATATNAFMGDGSTFGNAVAGYCTQGNRVLTIDDASFDSDSQEHDSLIATGSGTTTASIVRSLARYASTRYCL